MRTRQALLSGAAGALSLNLIHETARHTLPHAPQVQALGMRALAKTFRAAGERPPHRDRLYWLTLAGDLLANGLYYSLVAADEPRRIWRRGLLLGTAAGMGAVFLPQPMGLGRQPGAKAPLTQLLTVLWYLSGGLVAAAVATRLARMPTR
ncbi:hypothetical protein [Kallotenue papyrolyticum]|uniref:hypothetical protein n=1 Tax=Kallotenue papyrolyticum TaxID=1325125 RepID=UPI000492BE2E|nr:hypothetical protein [Kallotenue papyrolyticum]